MSTDAADRAYEADNQVGGDVPVGIDNDNDYKSRTGQSHIPVQSDDAALESGVNPATEDSDAQLQKDDADAIDESNIVSGKTRGAKPSGGYKEPGDEEGLPGPGDTGASAVAGGR